MKNIALVLAGVVLSGCAPLSPNVVPEHRQILAKMHDDANACFRLAELCYNDHVEEAINVLSNASEDFPNREMLMVLFEGRRYEEAATALSLIWAHDLIMNYSAPKAGCNIGMKENECITNLLSSHVVKELRKRDIDLYKAIIEALKYEYGNTGRDLWE